MDLLEFGNKKSFESWWMCAFRIGIFIEQNAPWPVLSSNGMSGKRTSEMGSLQGDVPQVSTWLCLPPNNKVLIQHSHCNTLISSSWPTTYWIRQPRPT